MTHHALLSLQILTPEGTLSLRKILKHLPEQISLISVSSIYKKYQTGYSDDLNSNLLCVIRIETDLDFIQLHRQISNCPGKWTLLIFDQVVSLTPQIPIPNPLLCEDPAVLRCASETWGTYEHPVVGQSLNELVRSVHSFENTEFFAQGRSIL